MPSFVTTGTICKVGKVNHWSNKFKTRELVIMLETEYNGIVYTDYFVMQLINNRVDLVEDEDFTGETMRFVIGDAVKCTWDIKGTRAKVKPGEEGKPAVYYNNFNCFKIEAAEQTYAPYTAPVTKEQQMENFEVQNRSFGGAQDDKGKQGDFQYGNFNPERIDDLPF